MSNTKHNSQSYRRSVKRTIELVKRLYGIHGKIPRGNRFTPKSNTDTTKKTSKAELRKNPDHTLSSIRYFSIPMTASSDSSNSTESTS